MDSEDYKTLEKVLDEISDCTYYNICKDLGILSGTCNELNNKGISTFKIAEKYLAQNPNSCWEKIIIHLREDFKEYTLAQKVADVQGIDITNFTT